MNLAQQLLTRRNIDQLSTQFGLSEEQTVQAVEALLPAFSVGLQRQTATPQGAASFIEALSDGHHARYAEEPQQAVSAAGIADGNAILGHLFGRKKVSRAVAERASAASGVSGTVLKAMLPALASMVMGALFKNSGAGGGLGKALGQAAGGGLLGTLIEGVAEGLVQGGRQSTRRRSRQPGLEDLLGGLLGGKTRAPRKRQPARKQRPTTTRTRKRSSGGGLGDLLGDLLGGGASPARRPRQRQRPADPVMPPPRRTRSRNVRPEDVFGDMLKPGKATSKQYRRETRDVFDQLLGE